MNWHYALGGQQQGPIDDAQLDALIAAGTITAETLVWREGLPGWQPLRLARPGTAPSVMAAPPPAVAPGEVRCSECGNSFTRDNVIQYGSAFVCAGCKPVFVQRLREGAAPAAATSGGYVSEEQLLAREYRIEIGECLSRGWKTFTNNLGIVIGVSLLLGILYFGIAVVAGLISMVIPLFNQLVLMIVGSPIAGGFFWFLLRLVRDEPATVGDGFAGFSKRFVPLMLSSIIQGLFHFLCFVPVGIVAAVAGFSMMSGRGGPASMAPMLIVGLILTGLVSMAALIYVTTIWTHSYLLVADKGYKFWPAMQMSRRLVQKGWWMTFLLNLVGGIIVGVGGVVCVIGIGIAVAVFRTAPLLGGIIGGVAVLVGGVWMLVTIPLYFLMRSWFYNDNFRDLEPIAPVT